MSYLRYLFTRKTFKANNNTLEDVGNQVQELNLIAKDYFQDSCGPVMTQQYTDLLVKCIYNQECYSTNKFAHFLVLEQRGFVNETEEMETNADNRRELKDFTDDLLENFDANLAYNSVINKCLKIPLDTINNYKKLFIDKYELAF